MHAKECTNGLSASYTMVIACVHAEGLCTVDPAYIGCTAIEKKL